MLDIGLGYSLEENSVLAVEQAVKQAKANLKNSSKIDLGLIFNSYDFFTTGITRTFNHLLPGVPLIGASGPAIITSQEISKHGIAILLLGFPEGIHCNTAVARDISEKNPSICGKELAEKLILEFKNIPRNLGILFFDKLTNGGPNFISGLQEVFGKSFPCIGASLSAQDNSTLSALYLNNETLHDSCAGMLWGGKISFGMGIKHGWKPLGKPHIASDAIGNIINSIDDKPAVELYEDYLSYDAAKLKKHLNKLSISYPIGVFIPGEEEYLLRNVISIEDRGSLICHGNIPEGSTIRLMISTQETCLNAATQAIQEALENLESSLLYHHGDQKNTKFAVVFSSISRYNLLRRDIKKELNLIKSGLGEIPFIGIYTHGELAPLTASNYRGQVYFHNQDFSVLIIEG